MPRRARLWPFLLLLLGTACDRDPFERPGTVAPRGLNEDNLRAMVADPADLRRGVEARISRGAVAAQPVDKLLRGQRAPLNGGGSQQGATPVLMMGGQDATR